MKNKITLIILIIISISALIFVNNNHFLYKNQIIKITNIENKQMDTSTNPLGLVEKYYKQNITGIIMNSKDIGKNINLENEYSFSQVVTEKYEIGDELFISHNHIEGLKRDKYIVLMIVIFVVSIYLIGKIRGLLTIVSLVANITIFYLGLQLYFKGYNLLFLTMIEIILFTIISLFMASGRNKKTLVAISSVLVTIVILYLITAVVVYFTNYSGVNFGSMEFLSVPVNDILMPELLIGGLGAIMDISITMSSSVYELITKNKNITVKSLKKSGQEIGKDVFSTMINVLFFTYLCSGLPNFVLAIRNGFTLNNYIVTYSSLELMRFLIGSIGIILTIPISLYIAIQIFKRGDSHE